MTTFFLESAEPVILCAPRKVLLKNKSDQMRPGSHYYYQLLGPAEERAWRKSHQGMSKVQTNYAELQNYLGVATINGEVPKILCTYDSLPHVLRALQGCPFQFRVVIDEAHTIFGDTELKPEKTEALCKLLSELETEITYISATPDKENFDRIEYFGDLTYVELQWDPSRVIEQAVRYVRTDSTLRSALEVIKGYQATGAFQSTPSGEIAREAVFFINDVAKICRIIRESELTPADVNIICSDMSKPKIRRNLGKGWKIGVPPKAGEPHKTFTFCSKTAFMGCDFYSPCAYTYIFADSNIKNMTSDISLDLPQILGRQRLDCNPFKSEATVFVNTTTGRIESEAEFKARTGAKISGSDAAVIQFAKLDQASLCELVSNPFKLDTSYLVLLDDYQVSRRTVIRSEMRRVAEERAWRLRNMISRSLVGEAPHPGRFPRLGYHRGFQVLSGIPRGYLRH